MPKPKTRFSKAVLAEYVFRRIAYLQKTEKFDLSNGSKQVEGKGSPRTSCTASGRRST